MPRGDRLTAAATTATWLYAFRFLTGFGIGGEYSAINSWLGALLGVASLIVRSGSYAETELAVLTGAAMMILGGIA